MKSKKRILCVIPAGHNVGLTSISLALVQALRSEGVKVGFFKPISVNDDPGNERSTIMMRDRFGLKVPQPIGIREAERLMAHGEGGVLMERIVENYWELENYDVVVVEGIAAAKETYFSRQINSMLVNSLDADVAIAISPNGRTAEQLLESIQIEAQGYDESGHRYGVVVNKIGKEGHPLTVAECSTAVRGMGIKLYGAIPWLPELVATSQDKPIKLLEIVERSASYINRKWISPYVETPREHRISPAEFRSMLIRQARQNIKRIVLPEGAEPRTLQAAAICAERNIAQLVLLGKEKEIRQAYRQIGMDLPEGIEVIDPATIWKAFVEPLYEARKSRGMSREEAEKILKKDTVMLGTMMLHMGVVDGLVSGALHTTADTVRPAMQVIKMPPGGKLISSIFFMGLPHQMLIYGDCAVNSDPDAEDLAEIAIQCAEMAETFGIPPRVAMLSFSTGKSGKGESVDRVAKATALVRKKRPDILIDGPLQYDAALIESVAKQKAPDSPVAGKATVFVFPGIDAGNITYKAVQRSAHIVSVGPILQGLAKPVNDLSRGCLVDDIVYTIALTCIQAQRVEDVRNGRLP